MTALRHAIRSLRSSPGFAPSMAPLQFASTGSVDVSARGNWPDTSNVRFGAVQPEYFALLGIDATRGRLLQPSDVRGAPAVAVINEAAVRLFPAGTDPIGRLSGSGRSSLTQSSGARVRSASHRARRAPIASGRPPAGTGAPARWTRCRNRGGGCAQSFGAARRVRLRNHAGRPARAREYGRGDARRLRMRGRDPGDARNEIRPRDDAARRLATDVDL
jgi:hypothetical protein